MAKFRDLKVWDKAHKLTLEVYETTRTFPSDELYGLTSQLRRSCASIPTNISEGCGRGIDTELVRFLWIAQGSAAEVEYQLLLARDLDFIAIDTYVRLDEDVREIQRMLNSFIQKISGAPNRHTHRAED